MGSQGLHLWQTLLELHADDSWNWAVGISKDSWLRKNGKLIEFQDTFLLCVKDNHHTLWIITLMSHQCIDKPLGRVGVFLDVDYKMGIERKQIHPI